MLLQLNSAYTESTIFEKKPKTFDSFIAVILSFQVSSDKGLTSSPTPDLYSFTIAGLKGVADKHGSASPQVADASNLVTKFLHQVSQDT